MSDGTNWGGFFLIIPLFVIALAIFLLLLVAGARLAGVILKRKFRLKWILLSGTGIFILVSIASFIYLFPPFVPVGKPILISRVTTRSGMEMRLTQTRDGHRGEPYTVDFYYKERDNQSWKWFYIDHEDVYWWSGDIKINEDSKRVTIFRGSKPLAHFDWEQETLTFLNSRGAIKGPQKIIPESELDSLGLPVPMGKARID